MRLLEVFVLFIKLFNIVKKLDADSLLSVLTPITTYDRNIIYYVFCRAYMLGRGSIDFPITPSPYFVNDP